jgi:hypothetical protein
MEKLINGYLEKGVHRNKIFATEQPSVCIWSLTRKCLVSENKNEAADVIDNKLSFKNNRIVSLQTRDVLTQEMVDEINNSDGIIVTDATYGKPYFRYAFIPTK